MKYILFILYVVFYSRASGQEYYNLSPEKFFELEEVNDTIDFAHFNNDLLAAAIFHQTNLQRKSKDQLKYNKQLADAAQYHSDQMVEKHFFDHNNRFSKEMKTPVKRAEHFGFPSTFVGENIIEEIALNYKDNSSYNYKDGDYYNENYSKQLNVLTYKTLAEKIVNSWMHSSGHRQNILNKEYQLLGIGVKLEEFKPGELPMIIATQVFGTITD